MTPEVEMAFEHWYSARRAHVAHEAGIAFYRAVCAAIIAQLPLKWFYPRPHDEEHIEIVKRLRSLGGYAPPIPMQEVHLRAAAYCRGRGIAVPERGRELERAGERALSELLAQEHMEPWWTVGESYADPVPEPDPEPSMFRGLCDGDPHRATTVDVAKSLGGSWWRKCVSESAEAADEAGTAARTKLTFVQLYAKRRRLLLAEQRRREASEAMLERLKQAAIEREKQHAERYGTEYGQW